MIVLRFARPEDAPALLEIYRPYVEETSITFETQVPSEAEFCRRITEISSQFPYLVAEESGVLLGYAYAHPFHERAAYSWTVESSIYVSQAHRGRHIGTMLYRALLPLLERQGVKNVCAVVTYPNDPSIGFHGALGFSQGGILPDFGYKLGAWHSVAYLYRSLDASSGTPGPIRPIHALNQDQVSRILADAAGIS